MGEILDRVIADFDKLMALVAITEGVVNRIVTRLCSNAPFE